MLFILIFFIIINMEYKSNPDTKTFDYSSLGRYGQGPCGMGVVAPAFKVYPFGSQFSQKPTPVTLCNKPSRNPTNFSREYRDQPFATLGEFGKMMRTKNY